MRNSIILMVVTVATAAFASPIASPTATRTSVAATPTSNLFPDGFTVSVPGNEKVNHDPPADTTSEEYLYQDGWEKYWDTIEEAEWNRPAGKRNAKRKHGVVCNIL